ncbi:MAG TPA: hypothetical protein DCM64_04850 [Gammaproteobacteria bacterium]|jgi:hypothetical protein|nr:hypothetical protein [Gammaproteobacteria bacterium]HAJ75762.1 hypothetical protein [Gammaproteobacteria bacterium]|tara:strand:+ start:586 stop:1371 length:786 start_codon:yes stop_codon:yes gene_type:complete
MMGSLKSIRFSTIFLSLVLVPSLAFSQGNGNEGNPNAAIAELQQDVADLSADISLVETNLSGDISLLQSSLTQSAADLQAQIDALKLSTVAADCQADPDALQNAVDAAPAAGAIINVSGNCNSTVIFAKRNLVIDGCGSTLISGDISDDVSAALYIEGSTAIQISGVDVDANGDSNGLLTWSSQIFLYDSSVTSSGAGINLNLGSTAIMANVDSTSTSGANTALNIGNNSAVISNESLTLTNATGQTNASALNIAQNSSYA